MRHTDLLFGFYLANKVIKKNEQQNKGQWKFYLVYSSLKIGVYSHHSCEDLSSISKYAGIFDFEGLHVANI